MAPHFDLVTPEEADLLLIPELRYALYATEADAWTACKDWPQRYPEFALGDGCFAHVMNEATTTFARRHLMELAARGDIELDDDPGFLLVKVKHRDGVPVNKSLGLKFNKLNEDLQPRGNRSYQNAMMLKQGVLPFAEALPLEEVSGPLPAMTVATVGWCPDPDLKRDPYFAVACNVNGRLLWSVPLLKPPAAGAMPLPTQTQPPPQGGPRVRSTGEGKGKQRRAE